MRFWAPLCGLILLVVPAAVPTSGLAGDQIDLARVMRLGEVIEVLREEGRAYGQTLNRDMLGGRGGAFWTAEVARIYGADRMEGMVQNALLNGMDPEQIDRSLAFFGSDQGQKILSLETSARRAMVDPDIAQIAFDTYTALKDSDDARLALITRLVEVNDLIEYNVAGSLSSNFYFLSGLAQSGGSEQSEAQITADVWRQEAEIRIDTREWIFGFMLMAYDPLGDADLEAYISYSATPAGQALNAALFGGFDAMYQAISHDLGRLVGRATKSSEL
ncbi:MAG: DUF2059 domain-containing protein [Rhodobacteraceae bacterium]|nr:DUF2059 domain-containing protein [Paracoccaceae bacterium]